MNVDMKTDRRAMQSPWTPAASRQRGSLLILCVVSLVIIALLGMAYLQQVKMDRFATAKYERDYMTLVINGILADLRGRLHEDVFENRQRGRALYDYPWTDYTATHTVTNRDGDPVTVRGSDSNKDDRWLASTAPIVMGAGTNATNIRWLHLTNTGGIWLDLPNLGSANIIPFENEITSRTTLAESDTNITGNHLDGTRNAAYERRGVDTDGDGVLDAMWTWAPTTVRNLGGREYVTALRVIDLSSMINVNTATVSSNGTGPLPDWDVRGETPLDVDLLRLLSRALNDGGSPMGVSQAMDELERLAEYRTRDGQPDIYFPLSLDERRENYWGRTSREVSVNANLARASLYSWTYTGHNYGLANEMELRYLAGLDRKDNLADIEHPTVGMPIVTRSERTAPESSWQDVESVQNLHRWFYGGVDDTTDVANREFPGVRHMLTTASGTALYSPTYSAAGGMGGSFKYDLRDSSHSLNDIRERIWLAFKHPGVDPTFSGLHYPDGTLTPEELDLVIAEYALALVDYADEDHRPSYFEDTLSAETYYGLERLPFLREVYVQALYANQGRDAADLRPGDPDFDGTIVSYDRYVYDESSGIGVGGDTRAMAIELGNPFGHTIHLDDLNNTLRIRVIQGGTEVSSWVVSSADLTAGSGDPSPMEIGYREDGSTDDLVVIYSPPLDPVEDYDGDGESSGADMATDLGFDGVADYRLDPSTNRLYFEPNGDPIVVELQFADPANPGGWVTYDRFDTGLGGPTNALAPEASYDYTLDVSPQTERKDRHYQGSAFRDGRGIYYLFEMAGNHFLRERNLGANNASDEQYSDSDFDQLGEEEKSDDSGGGHIPSPWDQDFANFQLFHNNGEIRSVTEVAWTLMFGLSRSEPFTERLVNMALSDPFIDATTRPLESPLWYLDINPDPGEFFGSVPAGHSGLPHAAMLLDQFTAVSPRNDELDNDNDDGDGNPATGADNPREQFVPGTINVNTATLPVLTLAAPLQENIAWTEALMRTIVAYRDAPLRYDDTTWSSPLPVDPRDSRNFARVGGDRSAAANPRNNAGGIVSLGELLFLNPELVDTGNAREYDMQELGYNPTALTDTSPLNTYPDPVDADNAQPDPGPAPSSVDREGALARMQFLSQTYTVRSDRFVVYGVVRGYQAQGFNQPAVEEAQFIAILDRSEMVNANDSPRVIAFRRLR